MASRRRQRSRFGRDKASTLCRLNVRKILPVGLLLILPLLLLQIVGYAAPAASKLQYMQGFLVTGDYVVGGVDLTETANPIVDGFSTGTILMGNAVPANADILAAHLFWETITLTSDRSQAAGVKFRGMDIDIDSLTVHEAPPTSLTGTYAPCWASGTPLTMHHFEADVLRFLPVQADQNDQPTGKRIVNDADLQANGLQPHTVTLPVRAENQIPESAGASLVVVYREDPEPGAVPTEPLRKIVIYNGMHIQGSIDESTTLNIQGFYKRSSSISSAKVTHIVGSGQPNSRDRILFNGLVKATDPFKIGSASQRGWDNPTYDVSAQMNGATNSTQYGETVTTTIDHQPTTGGYDCVTSGAVVFSTAVEDIDEDGLPDGLEDASGLLKDPDGTELPKLHAMGAGSDQKDIFLEVNAMSASAGTPYGSATAPYSPTITTKTDSFGHHHMPTPEDLQRIGYAYERKGIRAHFDVGNVTSYHGLGVVNHTDWVDDYGSTVADQYLVGNGVLSNIASLARGGEIITETACDPSEPWCQFPDFPGTVGWKFGFQLHRDRLVGDAGEEISLDPAHPDYFDWNAGTHRRRFDPGRRGVFHYLLYAHARGTPRSLPCLVHDFPSPYDSNNGTACNTPNPDFNPDFYHVPTTAGGIADLPGGNLLVTVGLWDDFVGRPFSRASTTFHELGHNFELWHGGRSPTWGNKALGTFTSIEPQCKPFHLSSMSYMFQVHGLFDDNDEIHLDYSGTQYSGAPETGTLSDDPLSPTPPYQPAWFAPALSLLAGQLGVSPSTKFCNGRNAGGAAGSMARVHAASSSAFIDWNGDTLENSSLQQDVNFDGTLTQLNGFDDWNSIRLNQVGAIATGLLPGSGENLVAELGDVAAELAELGAELSALGGEAAALGGEVSALAGEVAALGGEASALGGEAAALGGEAAALGGEAAALGGEAAALGGEVSALGGEASALGGEASALGGEASALGGEASSRDELTFTLANELGKSRPHQLTVCVIGRDPGCSNAPEFDPNYHRVEGHFNAPPFGEYSGYEVQRKRADASDTTFVTVGTTSTNSFIDPTELANGVAYVYRVRGLAVDGNNSEWSQISAPVTASNDAPQAVGNGTFTVDNKSTLPLVIQTQLLFDDRDVDSPTAFVGRRLVVTVQPAHGTLTLNGSGTTLTYKPTKNYVGPDNFKYKTDDGLSSSSDAPPVALSGLSNEVTVTINVIK